MVKQLFASKCDTRFPPAIRATVKGICYLPAETARNSTTPDSGDPIRVYEVAHGP